MTIWFDLFWKMIIICVIIMFCCIRVWYVVFFFIFFLLVMAIFNFWTFSKVILYFFFSVPVLSIITCILWLNWQFNCFINVWIYSFIHLNSANEWMMGKNFSNSLAFFHGSFFDIISIFFIDFKFFFLKSLHLPNSLTRYRIYVKIWLVRNFFNIFACLILDFSFLNILSFFSFFFYRWQSFFFFCIWSWPSPMVTTNVRHFFFLSTQSLVKRRQFQRPRHFSLSQFLYQPARRSMLTITITTTTTNKQIRSDKICHSHILWWW